MLILLVSMVAFPACAEVEAPSATAMTQSPENEDPAQALRNPISKHRTELLVGASVLGSIVFIAATILVFMVRHLKRQGTASGSLGGPRGGQHATASKSGPAREILRGVKAFPSRTGERGAKPARSGDTTPLAAEGSSASREGRERVSSTSRDALAGSVWTALAAWAFLIAGLLFLARDSRGYAISAPLLLIAFLLAVMAMVQRRILFGSLVLATLYLGAPVIWLVRPPPQYSEPGERSDLAAAPLDSPSSDHVASVEPRSAFPSATPAIDATVPGGAATEMPRLLVPEDDALPSPTASPFPPSRPLNLPPLPPKARDALFCYRTRLSHADHLNADGVDLRTLARTKFSEVLLQERLHVHQNARHDPEDSVDEEFSTRPLQEYRALFEGKPLRMPTSVSLMQLLKDDAIMDVQVFDKFIQVDPVTPLPNP